MGLILSLDSKNLKIYIMKTLKYIVIALIALLSTSCLKMDLDELPAFEDADITSFKFEYRWMGMNADNERLFVVQLKTAYTVDSVTSTVNCDITVPAVSVDFPQEEYDEVALTNIVGYAAISTAATMEPVGDSPSLGVVADFSGSDMQYQVTAADGSSKIWTVNITSFTKL